MKFSLAIVAVIFMLSPARADTDKERPLFEWGFFLGHGSLADYPSSDQYRLRTLPVPIVRYRGEIFRAEDQEGTRFRFLKSERFDIDFSFGGNFPTDADANDARRGMPALDWTLEAGPRLLYYFYKDKYAGNIRVGLPLRFSVSTDFIRWNNVGSVLAPTFQIDYYRFLLQELDLFFIADFNFFSEGMADYFYQIEPQYQTTERGVYDARSGYLGYDVALALKYERNRKTFILAGRYSDNTESANRTSYLHRTNVNWTFFIGIGLLLFESEEKAYD